MRKVQLICGLALVGLLSSSVLAAPFSLGSNQNAANAVVLTYDPASGHLHVDGNGVSITTFELKSAGSKFIPGGIPAGTISPPFDVGTSAKIFKLSTGGFPSLDLGHSYPAGLAADAVLADLDVNGSLLPSGGLTSAAGGGPFLFVIPEPSSIALICCGLLGLLKLRRK
jgi:hypothetical protein